jgi:uncharacterized surface protein with fasciclin (FAS1) repeats
MLRTALRFAAALAVPLTLVACGDTESPTDLSMERAEGRPFGPPPGKAFGPRPGKGDPAQGPTLVDVALDVNAKTGEFSTLIAALQAADLVDALDGRRPYTVFAPTDQAFEDLEVAAPGTLAFLLNPANKDALKDVLLYHVTRGKRSSPSVVGARQIRMLNGDRVRVSTNAQGAFVNDSKIVQTDVQASNGVIHIIDAVLVPPTN